jgi:CheY-like chemotaxis protein/anti-sigma regulatory factor (Ser/Thr protein kinase)
MASYDLLVVDDDQEIHELVRVMLHGGPWKLTSAFNGQEALTRLRASRFDVVLTDILMPGMDGLALLSEILTLRPDASVLVMTANNRPDRVADSIRAQAAGYLGKPFSKQHLAEALADALAWKLEPDDIEVLSAKHNWISVKARCKLEVADRLVRFFREIPSDLDPEEREAAASAFRELLINAVEHGGKFDPEKKVELHFVRTKDSILYYVRDPGEGFSLDNLDHAAVSHPGNPIEHIIIRQEQGIRPGGFGLLLLNNFADELIYNAKGNEVILIKRIK